MYHRISKDFKINPKCTFQYKLHVVQSGIFFLKEQIFFEVMYYRQQNNCYQKRCHMPISKRNGHENMHANLLAHNNIAKSNLLLRSNFITECCN